MEYFAYYSAAQELDDDFTDEFILYMEAYYPGYSRIFNNTKDRAIRMIRNGKKKVLKLSAAEESAVLSNALYDQADEMIHTALMKKLADRLPAGITIVFNDIKSLGNTPAQIWDIYEYFMRKGIYMTFVSGSAMDSKNILLLSRTMTPEITKYIKTQINAFCQETERKQNMPFKLADRSRQEKKELLLDSSAAS